MRLTPPTLLNRHDPVLMVQAVDQDHSLTGAPDDLPETEGPERSCIVTRQAGSLGGLIRFVAAPDGTITPDLRRKLPGRGAHVSLSRAAVMEAIKRKAFDRALKTKVVTPPDLANLVGILLKRDAVQALSFANKAGLVVMGFTNVESAIGGDRIAALIAAQEAAEDGRRKIGQALRRCHGDDAVSIRIVTELNTADLELALGRSHVIHAALVRGAAAESFLQRWSRLVHYESDPLPVMAKPVAKPVPAEPVQAEMQMPDVKQI
jgi:uncharacterized protein